MMAISLGACEVRENLECVFALAFARAATVILVITLRMTQPFCKRKCRQGLLNSLIPRKPSARQNRSAVGKFARSDLRSETPCGFGPAACLERNEKEDTSDILAPACRLTGHRQTIHESSIRAILDKGQQVPTSINLIQGRLAFHDFYSRCSRF